MTSCIVDPDNCNSMVEVRAGVDATDLDLIEILERRFGYMRAAARIKSSKSDIRDEERKRRVILAAVNAAKLRGMPEERIAALWDALVETSIAYEFEIWEDLRSES